jgi:23S rRNA pseudouridine1911/1915/1917 synthase
VSAEVRSFVVPVELAGLRLDVAVARLAPELTRSQVLRLVEAGRVLVAGRIPKPAARLRGGEAVVVELEPPPPTGAVAQDLPLAVLHEDRDLIVLDKAAGMVVHPARGSPDSTVVNALMHRLGTGGALPRIGLVHRLDKDTSGCLVVARTDAALQALQAQWKGRTVDKVYLALCHGALAETGRLDTPYGRHPTDRTRYTGRVKDATRRAVTEWRTVERFGVAATLVEVTLHTGRTHQIRVHLSEAGHPLLADTVYGGTRREGKEQGGVAARASRALGRQALHAARLAFDHPRTGKRLVLEAPLPEDFRRALAVLRKG